MLPCLHKFLYKVRDLKLKHGKLRENFFNYLLLPVILSRWRFLQLTTNHLREIVDNLEIVPLTFHCSYNLIVYVLNVYITKSLILYPTLITMNWLNCYNLFLQPIKQYLIYCLLELTLLFELIEWRINLMINFYLTTWKNLFGLNRHNYLCIQRKAFIS